MGDISFQGNVSDFEEFNKLMGRVPLDKAHKLVVLGNHDERKIGESAIKSILTECTLLLDEEVTVDGLRIYGTRWTNPDYTKIPAGLDVLVTHGAPYGLFDFPFFGQRMGDQELLRNIAKAPPHLHLFGHNHDEEGYCAVRYKGSDHWTLEANVNIIFGNCHSRSRVNPFKVYYCRRNREGEGEKKTEKKEGEFYPPYSPYLTNRYDMETGILKSKYYEVISN